MPARPTKPNGTRSRRLTPKPRTPQRPILKRSQGSPWTEASSGWHSSKALERAALPARQNTDRFLREPGAVRLDGCGDAVLEIGPRIGGGEQDLRRFAHDRSALRISPLPGAVEHGEPVREVRRDNPRDEIGPLGLADRRSPRYVAPEEQLGHQHRLLRRRQTGARRHRLARHRAACQKQQERWEQRNATVPQWMGIASLRSQ